MANDPYKYFRVEARELIDGLSQGVLQIERGAGSSEELARLLRLAHTLKGASRVVKQTSIAEAAHAIEDVLAPHRRGGDKPVSADEINQVLKLIDSVEMALKALEPSTEAAHPTAPPAVEDTFQTARVSIDELDALLEAVSQAGIQLGALGKMGVELEGLERLSGLLLNELEQQRSGSEGEVVDSNGELRKTADRLHSSLVRIRRESTARLSTLASEMRQIRDQGNTLRLLPASVIFPSLERAVRDAAQLLQKEVEFKTSGGENRLDGHMLSALRDALLHMVRNAVDHGLEAPEERARCGKKPAGSLLLRVERRGNRMVFSCIDDGRGIDVAQVRNSAVSHGLISRAEANALSTSEAMRLIFRPGISTRSAVTDVSGRGIGLDVVREVAQRFKGEVNARSEMGVGTTIEMSAPVSLSSFTALVVDAAGLNP